MKALVTGGCGFIGSNLALTLEKEGYDVVVIDNCSYGIEKNLKDFGGKIIKGDIRTFALNDDYDVIFHQAAITDTTVYDEELMYSVNTESFKKFLDYAIYRKIPLIYASSAAVYGAAEPPQSEDKAGKPLNVYGLSKWKCDLMAMDYIKKYPDAKIVGLRYFNVFGPREQHKGKMASMVYQIANQLRETGKVKLFKYGEQARDQVYVKDVVRANILASKSGKNGIVNVGAGQAITFNYIVDVVSNYLGIEPQVIYVDNPYKAKYQEKTEADLTLAKKLIGYEPIWKFEDAVRDYLEWLGWRK